MKIFNLDKGKKIFFPFFTLLLIIISCGSNNYFDRWPGQRLSTFPAEMQGNYKLNIDFFSGLFVKNKDSILLLTIDKNSIHEIDKINNTENTLSDSLVLSKLGNYYVLSSLNNNDKGYWTLGYFKIVKNGLTYVPYMGVDKVSDDNLAKYLPFVATYKTGRTTINSLPLKDREAFYKHHTDTINYYEMDDTKFLSFMENEKPQILIKFNKIYPKKRIK
jgi:hypothetical protein